MTLWWFAVEQVTKASTKKAKSGGGVARTLSADTEGLEEAEARAVELGVRVDQYLAAASAQVNDLHVQLWPELHAALTSWAKANGNPHAQTGVVALWRKGNTAIERFLSAYTKTGALIPGIPLKSLCGSLVLAAQRAMWRPLQSGDIALRKSFLCVILRRRWQRKPPIRRGCAEQHSSSFRAFLATVGASTSLARKSARHALPRSRISQRFAVASR